MQSVTAEGIEFIGRCALATAAASVDDFNATTKRIGFDAGACGAWVGVGANRRSRFFFVTWPTDWLEFYEKNQFFRHDPAVAEARRRLSAFWFSEIVPALRLAGKQKELHEAVLAYGYNDVFIVPIHGPGSVQGVVTLATRRLLPLGPADRTIVEMMSRAIWERCRTAEGSGVSEPARVQLSPRELECLQWAAAGKSDSDIAVLVGIKPATAHFHIEQAKKRFGVKTRVEAVAVGVLHGMI